MSQQLNFAWHLLAIRYRIRATLSQNFTFDHILANFLLIFSTDIKIVTKEIFNTDGKSQNWTNRAGSFLEQSRAFFDSYLGRWDRSNGEDMNDETIDDCTSGATSGEEVWGTPTSGENDEIQMFNSDQTHSVSE